MKIGLFYSVFFQLAQFQLIVDLYYSQLADFELKSAIHDRLNQNYANQVELRESVINSRTDLAYFPKNSNIIVDLISSPSISADIKEFAAENHIILISIEDSPTYNDWQFFSHSSQNDHESALSCLVSFFNWHEFSIISSNLDNNFIDIFALKKVNVFRFSDTSDESLVDLFVGKIIKPTGIRNLIILNQGETAYKLLKSLENKSILGSGAGVILGSRSNWNTELNGVVSYTESGLENATDYYSYEALSIVKILDLVLSFTDYTDTFALREFLERNTVNHHLAGNFTVQNIQNFQKINVGTISQFSLVLAITLIFPGDSTIIPNSPYTSIYLWIGDGNSNALGVPDSILSVIKDGAKYALSVAVADHFLDGFEILQTHIDCGADFYEPTFSLNCFKKLVNSPGIAYMPHALPLSALGDIMSMRSLNITIPLVMDHTAWGYLSNKTEFPEFMRMTGNDDHRMNVLIDLIYIFGWKNILVVSDDAIVSLAVYESFQRRIKELKINIVNKPEDRIIEANYNPSLLNKYKSMMLGLRAYKTRPLFVNMPPPTSLFFLADLHNAGIESGEFIFLCLTKISFAYTLIPDPLLLNSMAPIIYGGIGINDAEWLGDYGQQALKGFVKAYPAYGSDYRCFAYDAAWFIMHALKFTLEQGEDYYDHTVFNGHLRQQRFLGCSGIVSINSQSNDRNSAPVGIYNVRYDSENNILFDKLIGTYDLGSLQLFTFFESVNWYDNTTNIPSDTITYENGCPFKNSQIEYSVNGAGILYGISFGIALGTMIITFYIWKRWWNLDIKEIIEPRLIQFEDYIVMAIVFVDFLQFLAFGPDIKDYDIFSYTIAHFASVTFISQGKYLWVHLYFALSIVCAWVLFTMTHILRIGENSGNSFVHAWMRISKVSLPVLGNALFLPLVSTFLNVIQCDQEIGSEITQTFVRKDCSTFCWKDEHILWATLSMVCLILYLPLAIYFRPYWDYYEDFINIKTRPLFLMLKSVFQVTIIVLNKTVKPQSQALHGLFYCILLIIFIVICKIKKPYNESCINLWQFISFLGILWSVSLSSLYWIISTKIIGIWILSEYLGWLILVIVGVSIQRLYCPSMLFNEPGINIVKLFRFSLGKSVKAIEINKEIKEQGIKYNLHVSSSRMIKESDKSERHLIYG